MTGKLSDAMRVGVADETLSLDSRDATTSTDSSVKQASGSQVERKQNKTRSVSPALSDERLRKAAKKLADDPLGGHDVSANDVECMALGATVAGAGGGGSPYLNQLRCIELLKRGGQVR